MNPHGIEAQVCADIAKRQALGMAKYGTSVADNPLALREWLQHYYEELLDASVYARRAIAEIDAQAEAVADIATTADAPLEPADTDGWIAWAGAPRPVPAGTRVDVRFSDGDVERGMDAAIWDWTQVAAYRPAAGAGRD